MPDSDLSSFCLMPAELDAAIVAGLIVWNVDTEGWWDYAQSDAGQKLWHATLGLRNIADYLWNQDAAVIANNWQMTHLVFSGFFKSGEILVKDANGVDIATLPFDGDWQYPMTLVEWRGGAEQLSAYLAADENQNGITKIIFDAGIGKYRHELLAWDL
jgi:hypothetical protein